jgi:hypothetical protein
MTRRGFWTGFYRGLAGGEHPLPGSLCDELCDGHPLATAAGRWEPGDDPTAELRLQLAEAVRERNEEARINDLLRQRIAVLRGRVDGLELTVRAYAGQTTNDTTSQDHGDDLLVPWPAPAT